MSYSVATDSFFKGKTYHIISAKNIGGYSYDKSYPDLRLRIDTINYPSSYIGGIRISGEKVYYFSFSADSEKILYDYGINIGDTLTWKPVAKKVERIDTLVLPDSKVVKVFYFDTSHPLITDYWIEGIGSYLSFFGSYLSDYPNPATPEEFTRSFCYTTTTYSFKFPYSFHLIYDLDSNCFDISSLVPYLSTSPTPIPRPSFTDIKLYPNPLIENELHIETGNNDKIETITIYDITGKEQFKVDKPFSSAGNNTLSIPELPKGVYLIKANFKDNNYFTCRLIKM